MPPSYTVCGWIFIFMNCIMLILHISLMPLIMLYKWLITCKSLVYLCFVIVIYTRYFIEYSSRWQNETWELDPVGMVADNCLRLSTWGIHRTSKKGAGDGERSWYINSAATSQSILVNRSELLIHCAIEVISNLSNS